MMPLLSLEHTDRVTLFLFTSFRVEQNEKKLHLPE
jgi:hypothetical protein